MFKRVWIVLLLCLVFGFSAAAVAYDQGDAQSYLNDLNDAMLRVATGVPDSPGDPVPNLQDLRAYHTEYNDNWWSPMDFHLEDCVETEGPCYSGWWRWDAFYALDDVAAGLLASYLHLWGDGPDETPADPEYPDTIDGCWEIYHEMVRCWVEAWTEYGEEDWDTCVRFCQDGMAWEAGKHEVFQWQWANFIGASSNCYYVCLKWQVWYKLCAADIKLENCSEYDEEDPGDPVFPPNL